MLYGGVQCFIGINSVVKGCTVLYRGVQCCIREMIVRSDFKTLTESLSGSTSV